MSFNQITARHPNKVLLRPQLFKRWITLSTGQITIQRVSITVNNHCVIRWMEFYLVN